MAWQNDDLILFHGCTDNRAPAAKPAGDCDWFAATRHKPNDWSQEARFRARLLRDDLASSS